MAFLAGTDLTFAINLLNSSGAPISAVSVEYRVVDGIDGTVLLDWTVLSGFTPGSVATVTVPAIHSTLPVGVNKGVRDIELRCTEASGAKQMAVKFYVIESPAGVLVRGVNSMVALAGAEMLAMEIPGLSGWLGANRDEKTAALLEGYRRLDKLRFPHFGSDYFDRSQIYSKPSLTSLSDLSQTEILGLEPKLVLALSMAQVSEADFLMSSQSDPRSSARDNGLIMDQIGEVKQMYRDTKPIGVGLPVCRRTMSYLSGFTSFGVRVIGRA